jgi:hypothetical protein
VHTLVARADRRSAYAAAGLCFAVPARFARDDQLNSISIPAIKTSVSSSHFRWADDIPLGFDQAQKRDAARL